ncbi:hypothetical protein PG1C_07400 [Rugosibacter aromaticivorans]|uniref:Glycine zipper 2TM domain-containing protein n=1 Tax=Rugosibacter aromaticivorans TaxID=1565605 RepID=A0A0C5J8P1_9PROT|nr:glycine zipper 2TM domain-containing protein [Rugosibacter aromaticivorans]AJP48335.1 hypothetical protein PG1C_07400 [Rugosibacter aromaticivorans]
METTQTTSRTHPLILVAAAAVTAVALAGVGVLTGVLPNPVAAPATPMVQESVANKPAEPTEPTEPASASHAPKSTHKPVKAAVSPAPTYSVGHAAAAKCADCGVVEQIRELTVVPEGSGLGGIAGGVVGGLLGNQVGQGRGRSVATVAGVVGGALAGNQIEKTMKKKQSYEIVVRFEDGTTRTFPSDTTPAWREGDRVRLENGALTPR